MRVGHLVCHLERGGVRTSDQLDHAIGGRIHRGVMILRVSAARSMARQSSAMCGHRSPTNV